jgi:lipid-A-disaccharide synthase
MGAAATGPARRIVLIAGEPSGDVLGARLMAALERATQGRVRLEGVGGEQMAAAGLTSRFPMQELSHMGLVELVPHLPLLRRRLQETAGWLRDQPPDVLVTIDAPGFCLRLAQRLAETKVPRLHYVAPSVWAWKPGRAQRMAGLVDHLLALLPFEPPYFTRHGLACTYVGHPALETMAGRPERAAFRARHGIAPEAPVLCLLPGSRRFELIRLLALFAETVRRLVGLHPGLRIVLPTVAGVAHLAEAGARDMAVPVTIVADPKEKRDAFAASDAALAASGTVAVELAVIGTPAVIAYRANPLSAAIARRMIKVKYASLVNLLLDRPATPEFLQENCRPENLTGAIDRLLRDPAAREAQRAAYREALARLAVEGLPSDRAAAVALSMMGQASG